MAASSARPRRVLMMVDNKVLGDARVLKTAGSVAALGHRVVVLGRRRAADRPEIPDLPYRIRLVRVRRRHPDAEALTFVGRAVFAFASRVEEAEAGDGSWARFRARRRDQAMAATIERTRDLTRAAPETDPEELLRRDKYWQALQPALVDYEAAYTPVIDSFRPHVIHAHDFRMIGIAVRAARRLRAEGRRVRVVYDAHEFVPGLEETPEFLAGNAWYEASHIRLVDRIVTVSQPLAELLRDHHRLDRTPAVTLNAPEAEARRFDPAFRADVRAACGLAAGVPVLAYSGGVAPRRGLGVVVEGLARLPGVHLAVIANRDEEGRALIRDTAQAAGVTERVHILDFVPRERIIQHLATADVSVHPMIHLPNHEIALPNKFFDYVFAGTPVVVSDVKYLAEVVEGNGLGRSFTAGDPDDFARAVREVLRDLPRFRAAITDCPQRDTWTWEAQEPVLAELYDELTVRGTRSEQRTGP